MKKKYIIPEMCTLRIHTEQLVAESPMAIHKKTIDDENNCGWVKDNHSDYNVWDDDWSN